jgi:8-oxo-dGTP pyrophosphatase MutT (NUDIX family)
LAFIAKKEETYQIMSNNQIEGAGVILIREDKEQKVEHLFLKNQLTKYWEPPKGEIDKNEDFVYCALRELSEETGLNFESRDVLPIGPYYLNYNSGDKQKRMFLYAIHLFKNGETVKLSEEHADYIWESHSNLKKLIAGNYFSILNHVNKDFTEMYSVYSRQRKFQNRTINFLQKLITTYQLDEKIDWHLTGSVAALENTINNNNDNLSDIDIVAVTCDEGINNNDLANFINSEVEKELKTTSGISFISHKESISIKEPFWQYFKSYKLPLSNSKYKLHFENSPIETDIAYNLFRVIWYTLLRINYCSSTSKEYLFIKGIILLSYVGNKNKFKGYKQLFLELSRKQRIDIKQSIEEKDLHDALAVKLNIIHINKDWRKVFIKHATISLENMNCDSIEFLLSKVLLDMEVDNYSDVSEHIFRIINSHATLNKFEKMFSKLYLEEKNNLWIVLLIIRKTRWPEFFKYSGFKYNYYFKCFLEKAYFQELEKEQLTRIFNNISI